MRGLGADHVIDYTRPQIADGGHRYNVIIDIGGNRRLARLRQALTPTGTLVIVGGETDGRWIAGASRQIRARLLSPLVKQKLDTVISSENAKDLDRATFQTAFSRFEIGPATRAATVLGYLRSRDAWPVPRCNRGHYNTVRLHAGIGYVTPDQEHRGEGAAIRQARRTSRHQLADTAVELTAARHEFESINANWQPLRQATEMARRSYELLRETHDMQDRIDDRRQLPERHQTLAERLDALDTWRLGAAGGIITAETATFTVEVLEAIGNPDYRALAAAVCDVTSGLIAEPEPRAIEHDILDVDFGIEM